MKYIFFWDERFANNQYANTSIDPNLSPFREFLILNWVKNTQSIDIFESGSDKSPDDAIILCFLACNIFTFDKYITFLWKYRKYRKYLFLLEPPVVARISYFSLLHLFFDRVYTWNDRLVDHNKYRKYTWQQSYFGINTKTVSFQEKFFLTLLNGNKTSLIKNELYSEREKAIRFFEKNNIEFDLYGVGWNKPNRRQKIFWFHPYPSYKWKVDNKIETLSQYKFNLCFENMKNEPWYITEKIWDSFKARSIPIYWGASNIEDYIPTNTFIDFRQFEWDYEKLVTYLSQITEIQYNEYIENIETFLWSKKAQEWFDEEWAKWFLKKLY